METERARVRQLFYYRPFNEYLANPPFIRMLTDRYAAEESSQGKVVVAALPVMSLRTEVHRP